jgi:Histidine kinase-, DNA gyrase B-, and HSP90-like ATPase
MSITTDIQKEAPSEHGIASIADLVQPGQALESSRDSGFDLPAAVGEPTDNSIQAGARIIRIATTIVETKTGQVIDPTELEKKGAKRVDTLAIADDGHGIPQDILAPVLSLGYGTRMNDRAGLGRFGMGLKLSALSQARRLDVWTRSSGSDQVFHAYLDLDEVIDGTQKAIEARMVDGFPADHAHLMTNPKKKTPFTTGTLVVWSKIDRLEEGGRFGQAIRDRLQELTKYLARTYRVFLAGGLFLELNNIEVTLHDPLFLLDNPRVTKLVGEQPKAQVFNDHEIDIDGQKVRVRVTLVPEALRPRSAEGGKTHRDFQIPENQGKVSVLRQGREIFYDTLHHSFFPRDKISGGREQIDRYIGVEISFPAPLDEYFRVRNVKKGAEPDTKLREEIRKEIEKPILAARAEVRSYWEKVRREERPQTPPHKPAEDAVARAEEHTPPGQAGRDLPQKRQQQIVDDLVADLDLEENADDKEAKEQAVREAVETKPISIVDLDWPGKELIDITHLNGNAVVKINRRHPFIREIYSPLKELAGRDPNQLDPTEVIDFLRTVEVALDVLLMAYAKAENMDAEADTKYADLRSYWGQFTAAYIGEMLRS